MNKIVRILKHRWLDESDARRALDAEALERLQRRIASSESAHSGEIRLCVEASLPMSYLTRGADARERALMMFSKLRVWDTEHNNGVLVYLLLAEHRIEIVADRGVVRQVPPTYWQEVVDGMSIPFSSGRFEEGLNGAIDAVTQVLVQHFALRPGQDNPNELPDDAHIR